MVITGKFNTDAKALNRRILAHDKYGSNDLNKWIFSNLSLANGISILDLGCGTGKQTIPMAKVVGNAGNVFSIDISQEALDVLSKEAVETGLNERITTLCCTLDDIEQQLQRETFERVLSSYSLYYAQNPEKVINAIWKALKIGGILFFCGPSKDNNRELKSFHYSLKGMPVPPETGGAVFMEDTGQRLVRELFSEVDIVTFENSLRFDSAEGLYSYWNSYNLYDDNLDTSFKAAATEHFNKNSIFETKKRVIGVKAIK